MKDYLVKIKNFVLKHKISTSAILLALVFATVYIYYDYSNNPIFNEKGLNIKKKEKVETYAPLTGLPMSQDDLNRRPIAAVIENSPDARPQSGYDKADIVYETLAEGGITRTLAIFHSKSSEEIGPVRSARPYFIDWLSEFNALFVHVGGSIDALDYISSSKIADLNQFNYGAYFWRSTSRYAPHNVYTTTQKIYEAAKQGKYEITTNNLKWYSFKKDLPEADRPQSQNITIDFSGPLFTASYAYNPKTNDYTRSIAGVVAKDSKSGVTIQPKNIIVQFETVSYGKTRANEQKVNIGTIGKGGGFLFQDGKAIKINWEKTSRTALTKITDEAGNEIKLNPGQTWIEVPPVGANVTY